MQPLSISLLFLSRTLPATTCVHTPHLSSPLLPHPGLLSSAAPLTHPPSRLPTHCPLQLNGRFALPASQADTAGDEDYVLDGSAEQEEDDDDIMLPKVRGLWCGVHIRV